MTEENDRPYARAYAQKIIGFDTRSKAKKKKKKVSRVRKKPIYARPKPIDKHGDYEGTDVGFTSDSIQNPIPSKNSRAKKKKPIDKHGNYQGTDACFTADFDE